MFRSIVCAAATAALISLCAPAGATTANYSFNGTTAGGATVDATAAFTWGSGSLTVVLTDLLQNPTSAGQLVNGVSFNISGASGGMTGIVLAGGGADGGLGNQITNNTVSNNQGLTSVMMNTGNNVNFNNAFIVNITMPSPTGH